MSDTVLLEMNYNLFIGKVQNSHKQLSQKAHTIDATLHQHRGNCMTCFAIDATRCRQNVM